MVPAARRSNRRAASTLLVASNPTIAEPRATSIPASIPWVRRNEKSTSPRPPAATTHRAAFDAIVVWNVTVFRRNVSTSWASAIGAVTSRSGSLPNTIRPSGTAHTSPVNRRSRKLSSEPGPNPSSSRR